MTMLPPGVHPSDQASPLEEAWVDRGRVVPLDRPVPDGATRPAPFRTHNASAVPVFQRLGQAWSTGMVVANAAGGSDTVKVVVRRTPGRTRLRIWVPSSVVIGGVLTVTPAGVMFGSDEGELQVAGVGGSPINVGDPPVDIFSEGGVWAGLIPGQAAGYVCYLHAWDPARGGLDF